LEIPLNSILFFDFKDIAPLIIKNLLFNKFDIFSFFNRKKKLILRFWAAYPGIFYFFKNFLSKDVKQFLLPDILVLMERFLVKINNLELLLDLGVIIKLLSLG
jgi:hypothetical protein